MSSHYKDLVVLFGEGVGRTDFDSVFTVDDALPFKRLFHLRSLLPREGSSNTMLTSTAGGGSQGSAFRQPHALEALRRVCNAMLESKGVRAGVDELRDESEVRLAWRFLGAFAKDGAALLTVDRSLARSTVDFNYATARPRMFDMFVHLSAGEMFIIDGDSLLMAALSQQHVDWDLMQPLHVIANAQAILNRLQRRGARFHVVFFDSLKWIWEKAQQMLFIRENLRLSMQTVSDTNPALGLVVANFESFHCDEFVQYVERWDPEFLLITDGEQLGTPNTLQALFNNSAEDIEVAEGVAVSAEDAKANPALSAGHVTRHYRSLVNDEAHGDQVAFYYRCFMVWAMSRHIKVAFSSRIVSRENALLVFALTVDSQQFARCLAIRDRTVELAAELAHDPLLADANVGTESLAFAEDADLPFVEQINSAAVHAYLHDQTRSAQETQLCQIVLAAAYCSALVGPELRAQRAPASAEVARFLHALAPYYLKVLLHRGCLAGRGAEFDIYDGHFIAILVLLAKSKALGDLLDEDSRADVDASWESVSGTKGAKTTAAPLEALPDVQLANAKTAIVYPHMTHELVERLAASFKVASHTANRPFPATFGNANKLSGWSVSAPFDVLNDVVDVYVEEEAKKGMTVKDRRRHMQIETAFVKDATQQAESMGIHGFTATRLTTAVSDDDEDDDDKKAQSGKVAQKQHHAKQKNQKTRSKNEIIREESSIREANRTVRDGAATVESLLKSTDMAADRTTEKARIDAIGTLTAAIRRISSAQYGRSFDPGEVIVEQDREAQSGNTEGNAPLKLAMWRLLVESSTMREAELAFAVSSKNASAQTGAATNTRKAARAAASGDDLLGFTIVDQLIDECTGGHDTPTTGSWGKLARLQNVGMNTYEAANFLRFVYLFYVQLHLQAKLMVRLVKLQLDNWKQERERARLAKQTPDLKIGAPLFLYCHHKVLALTRDFGLTLGVDDLDIVRSALVHFEFPADYYSKVDAAIARWQDAPVRLLAPAFFPVQRLGELAPAHVQLLHMGHLLERPVIPERDYRVVFNPDGWQRDLLDIVDARGSAVVCAPTSAGKTFISYYCMYNALKTSNTKVVVYVAPNRALINQAVADVCARYGSKTYVSLDRNVYGVHGGQDYHRYHDNCQVLVTLPEVLETLLLSPVHKEWTERLDYVILDEIHTMESSGNGDVWERVLALLPCPFVALSATLGETAELCGWLNRVQDRLKSQQGESTKKRDYVVHSVPASGSIQRWNDIRKYIYLPPAGYRPPPVKKLNAKYDVRYIQDLHPLSILTLDQLRNGFPPDITLVPSEVVQLYDEMRSGFLAQVKPKWTEKLAGFMDMLSQNLDVLDPEFYFSMETYITQQRARQYEVDVKASYVYWLQVSNGNVMGAGMDTLSAEDAAAFKADLHELCQSILQAFSQRLRKDEAALNEYATEAAQQQFKVESKSLIAQAEAADAGDDTGANPATTAEADGGETANAEADESGKGGASARGMVPFPDSKEFISEHVISVLREIHARDMGPTIVFSFETEDCDQLVKAVVDQLERAEARYRLTDEFAQYKATMERKAAAQSAARRQQESILKSKRLTKDEDGTVDRSDRTMDQTEVSDEVFVVPDVLPEFTFIGQNRTVDPTTIKNAIADCIKNGDDLAARAIQRGVGVHHAGVKGKLRRQMEILFRGRHCGVIFATETLALGVHSPCRSVVLAGDHVLLNTTQFRQMMGRAGRRGLDYLGHLIFLSISMKKITRLMTSSMTVIKGNVQVNPVTQLRLLQLYDFQVHRENPKYPEPWKQYALSLAERLYANPLFFEGRAQVEGGNMEPFTVEMLQMVLGYFQKEGLHFKDRPSSLGSLLVDALHIFRNAGIGAEGFSFVSMLTRNVFANAAFTDAYAYLNSGVYGPIPADSVTPDLEASHPSLKRLPCTEAVAEVMAYLCTVNKMCGVPMELHRSVLSDPVVMELWAKKPNMRQHRVVLAPLRLCTTDKNTPVMDNRSAFRVISAFYTFLASTLTTPANRRLPYMSSKTRAKNPIFPAKSEALPLCDKLKETAVPFAARDMFVALSGCGDHFANADDLVQTLRNGLFCDRNMLPFVDLADGCRHDGAQVLINACVADFVRCKAQIDSSSSNYRFTLLEELNGLSQSESFAALEYAERLLSNMAGLVRKPELEHLKVLEALFPEEDTPETFYAGAPQLLNFCHLLHQLHSQIVLDLAGDQMRARFEEMKRKRESAAAN